MSKPKRGKNAKTVKDWRGTCPLCSKARVKLLWNKNDQNGNSVKCCKVCGV